MRWISWFILASIVGSGSLIAVDYETRFQYLESKNSSQQVEEFLCDWRTTEPKNPEAWIDSANHYFSKGIASVEITSGGDWDDGTLPIVDQAAVDRAIGFLQEGIRRFPDRLDIRFGLSYILEMAGKFDKQFSVIKDCVTYSKAHTEGLLWLKGQPLPSTAHSFIPQLINEYADYYSEHSGEENRERFLKLTKFVVKSYPDNITALLHLAGHYEQTKDYNASRNYYAKVLKLNPNANERDIATKALDELNQKIH